MSEARGLDGFSAAARRAIAAAEAEAVAAGTARVGTEHLLLGLFAVGSCGAAEVLRAAGVNRAAVRRKVGETTVGAGSGTAPTRSPRAERALHRAHRFAHDHRSAEVRSEHLLLAILDVEGTAGQVLRGLDLDVDRLRARLVAADLTRPDVADATDPPVVPPAEAPPPRCPSCGIEVAAVGGLAAASVAAGDGATAVVLSCRACGVVLGAGGFRGPAAR